MESQYKQLAEFIAKNKISNVTITDDLSSLETLRFVKFAAWRFLST